MTRRTVLAGALAVVVLGLPSGAAAQVRPASVGSARPTGAPRGSTVALTVEGNNLADASAVLFDHAGLSGRIVKNEDLGPDVIERDPESTGPPIEDRARDSRLAVEVTVGAEVPLGRHSFRLLTPLGVTNLVNFVVGALPEAAEVEAKDDPGAVQAVALPLTVNGTVDKADDVDRYSFEANAGQQIVFEVLAARIGSGLDSVLTLRDAAGAVLARNDDFRGRADSVLAHRFTQAGTYTVEVTDGLNTGGMGHFYRLSAGELPYVTGVFPLGVRRGEATEVELEGFNLPARTGRVDGSSAAADRDKAEVPVAAPLNMVEVAVGEHPEAAEHEPNDTAAAAQMLAAPLTVNGRIQRSGGGPDEDVFRFRAAKGQTLVFGVLADRLGSRLDSVLEVLDAQGRAVPRATLRPVWQTTVDLRDHDSTGSGLRLLAWSGLQAGDYVYVDRELMRLQELPGHPDADASFASYRGRRLAFEETTPEGHALNTPVYKVEVHPAGASLPSNGMPVFTLPFRNDDAGYTFGKDSRVTFTAPATGEYLLRLRDSRGLSGPEFAYRLTVSEPRPDFRLAVGTTAPNVPRGGRVPVYVSLERREGFDGPVDVELLGLPAGLQATTATIPPGSTAAAVTLSAAEDAPSEPTRFRAVARARIGDRLVEREAMMDAPASLALATAVGAPDLVLASVEPRVLELPAGGRAKITVRIRRANGFAGRVPVGVQNLPFGVHIPDIGLNGVLITEKQEEREFYLEADPHAPVGERQLFLTGRVEVNSSLPSEQASETILLRIVPRQTAENR
jgi:pre-peptidase